MYAKPKLERFGTFRELTLVGGVGSSDLLILAQSSGGASGGS